MCDLLRGIERKPEGLRRQVLPIIDRFHGGDAMERVINLCGGKMFRIKCQHLRRRQIFRIKSSFPFGVLKTGSANPRLHPIASSTVNNLSFAFTKNPSELFAKCRDALYGVVVAPRSFLLRNSIARSAAIVRISLVT